MSGTPGREDTMPMLSCRCRAIALDLNGAAWVVSQAGKVCILDIKSLRRQARAAALELVKRQQLVLVLPGTGGQP